MYEAAAAEFTPDRAGMHRLADCVLDHHVAHPELTHLRMHRWQSDAADITELERVYIQPELDRFSELFQGLTPPETDLEMALMTFIWTIHCFCTGGFLIGEGVSKGPENPIVLERFRAHLHRLADVLFGPEQ
jgi:hypothetical protein